MNLINGFTYPSLIFGIGQSKFLISLYLDTVSEIALFADERNYSVFNRKKSCLNGIVNGTKRYFDGFRERALCESGLFERTRCQKIIGLWEREDIATTVANENVDKTNFFPIVIIAVPLFVIILTLIFCHSKRRAKQLHYLSGNIATVAN